jgi:hypothetical protein
VIENWQVEKYQELPDCFVSLATLLKLLVPVVSEVVPAPSCSPLSNLFDRSRGGFALLFGAGQTLEANRKTERLLLTDSVEKLRKHEPHETIGRPQTSICKFDSSLRSTLNHCFTRRAVSVR